MKRSTETPEAAATTQHRTRLTLRIDATDYRVRAVAREGLPTWAVQAFTLTRDDPKLGKVCHMIAQGIDGPRCSCEDRKFRPTQEGCKHIRSARAVGLF